MYICGMKYIITITLLLTVVLTNAQVLYFNDIESLKNARGTFSEYHAESGEIFKIGDTVTLGTASGFNDMYQFVTFLDIMLQAYPQNNMPNTSVEIKKVRLYGNKRTGFKCSLQTKSYTSIGNLFIGVEDALSSGELLTDILTSDQALAKLKKEKEKLDLGLITQEEFDKSKTELAPIID
jgi:uncharacterized protein YxjI